MNPLFVLVILLSFLLTVLLPAVTLVVVNRGPCYDRPRLDFLCGVHVLFVGVDDVRKTNDFNMSMPGGRPSLMKNESSLCGTNTSQIANYMDRKGLKLLTGKDKEFSYHIDPEA